ncbi:MAG TPA: hypothetical protein VFM06_04570 [Candidatus Limnocylindria bacterium]|nr:hypothetical protein [Candidatus Limnocylindria bacterium]
MAKRHRTRPRTRRSVEPARRTEPTAARESVPTTRAPHRVARSSRTGYSRASGAPSQALERAAVAERTFVVKDFRRLGIIVGIALGLLVASGLVEALLLR